MKTAISIPDSTFYKAEETAEKLGLPRSQLYTRALEEYMSRHRRELVTEKLNEVYRDRQERDVAFLNAGRVGLKKSTEDDSW